MKKVIKQWLALTLAIGALVSCSEDRNEPSSTAEGGGETVTLSLSAEVSVDDSDLRAINYKLGTNAKDQLVPMPEFTDGQLVDVHTIIKSSRAGSVPVAKTLKWRYNATSQTLVLEPTVKDASGAEYTNDITIAGFNNDGGVKWYISGLIGGTLSGTEVTFEGKRELTGVDGNVGDIVGSLNVPYAFPWTELTINTTDPNNTRQSNNSYKYAQVPSTANLKFAPQGSLIAYKLGTNQRAGAYAFTPTGFTVSSNAFGDKGTFQLNTNLPTNSTPTVLPSWTEGESSALVYSFASGHEPGIIAHQQTADKTYYAWVMAHKTQPATVSTRVMIKGESARPETDTYRDYTKTWFTDYSVKGVQLHHGRVYSLKANATHTYRLPIEYVTDYNLAGGEGLTYVVQPGTEYNQLNGSAFDGVQPIGVTGPLRFANYNPDGTENDYGHRSDMSGAYSWYKVAGRYDRIYNPHTKDLQDAVDATFGAERYFIPTVDQIWSVIPHHSINFSYENEPSRLFDEPVAFGTPDALIRHSYLGQYTHPQASNAGWDLDLCVYGIRFMARSSSLPPFRYPFYDANTGRETDVLYPSGSDNLLKSAFRYVRLGRYNEWTTGGVRQTFLGIRVDVVYLGEESVPTELSAISDEQWWNDKQAQGLVISKTFPATMSTYGSSHDVYAHYPLNGLAVDYQMPNEYDATRSFFFYGVPATMAGSNANSKVYGKAIRLFRKFDF